MKIDSLFKKTEKQDAFGPMEQAPSINNSRTYTPASGRGTATIPAGAPVPPSSSPFIENELQAALSPVPVGGVRPEEGFKEWHSRASKAPAPKLGTGSPESVAYDNQVGEIKKGMGAAMGAMQGSRSDYKALFDAAVRNLPSYNNSNYDHAVFNTFNEVLEKNPQAKAAFEADIETQQVAGQRNLSPEMQRTRNEMSDEGKAVFDAKLDQRRLDQAFPEQREVSGVDSANKTTDMMGNLTPEEKSQVYMETLRSAVGKRAAENGATPMFQKEAFTETLDGGLAGAASRYTNGTATMEDMLALGIRDNRYGDYGTKTEQVEDGKDRYGRTQYRTRKSKMTADEWVAEQNRKQAESATGYMQYMDSMVNAGVSTDVAAKLAIGLYEQEQELQRQFGAEDNFESSVYELPDGQRVIGFRYGKDKGMQFRNWNGEEVPTPRLSWISSEIETLHRERAKAVGYGEDTARFDERIKELMGELTIEEAFPNASDADRTEIQKRLDAGWTIDKLKAAVQ